MTPRKHAELIKAWADGAEIQRYHYHTGLQMWVWLDDPNPTWADDEVYRREPTHMSKADYVLQGYVRFFDMNIAPIPVDVDVIFDGETREPKKVEIVK